MHGFAVLTFSNSSFSNTFSFFVFFLSLHHIIIVLIYYSNVIDYEVHIVESEKGCSTDRLAFLNCSFVYLLVTWLHIFVMHYSSCWGSSICCNCIKVYFFGFLLFVIWYLQGFLYNVFIFLFLESHELSGDPS